MDSVISTYNGLNKTGKMLYLFGLNLAIDFAEGKELKSNKSSTVNIGTNLEFYEAYLPKIQDPEIKAKCERFIKLRKENLALTDELNK